MSDSLTVIVQHILEQVQADAVQYIDLQFTDVTGMVKAVQIPARQLESAFRAGVWFDGSALEGFARVAESDMYLRPDPQTFAVLPWEQPYRTARLICEVYAPNGEPFTGDPRYVLRRAIHHAEQMNLQYRVSPELEFFLFRLPLQTHSLQPLDTYSYFDVSDTESRTIRRSISHALENMGIVVESMHHEVGTGQHEIDFPLMNVLQTADIVMTARFVIKAIAAQHNLYATFMPKPLAKVAGSGMHVHQLLVNATTSQNIFMDADRVYGLSGLGRSFIAGQLHHARGMCAVLAPLVNSYKRLMAGLEAPVYLTWAHLNRAALIRVPQVRSEHPEEVRVELRCPDPSCNPYLAFAVMLRAGLDGIHKGMELSNPAEEELYAFDHRRHLLPTLPTSLSEALQAMEQSELVNQALGLNVSERFIEAKRLEWNDYVLDVSPWELDRYLNTY